MRAGRLRHRINIVSKGQAGGSTYGDVQDTPVTLHSNVAAHVEQLRGREFYDAQQINTEITVKVHLRYLPGITRGMRVVHGSDTYEIVHPMPDDKRRELELSCKVVE